MSSSAARLCEAENAILFRRQGETYHFAANYAFSQEYAEYMQRQVVSPGRNTLIGRTALEAKTIHIPDVLEDAEYTWVESVRLGGYRTMLGVPLMREGVPVGVFSLTRQQVRLFTDKQIELVTTFADQAVIAIENVRLFDEVQARTRELSEALDQQTATSEVLQVISSSPGELEPVFNAMLENATRLCEAKVGNLFLREGDDFRAVAVHGESGYADWFRREPAVVMRDQPGTPLDRVTKSKQVLHIPDLRHDESYLDGSPRIVSLVDSAGARTHIVVPMLKEDELIGAIVIYRQEVRPFSDKQIELLTGFARQAVIAIENTRLLNELRQRTGDLAESLDQQTATSEILRVISASPTDVQPIFDAIVRSASRLCGGEYAIVTRYDGELLHLAAQHNPRPGTADATAKFFPQVPRRETSITARALIDAAVVHVSDINTEELGPSARETYRRISLRAVIAVPMVYEGRPIGVVSVSRGTPGPFSDRQIDLLRTFADQAVIAIENVRLFTELQASNRDLSESLQQQTATADVLKVISRSTFDLQTVLDTLVEFGGSTLRRGNGEHLATKGYNLPSCVELRNREQVQRVVEE